MANWIYTLEQEYVCDLREHMSIKAFNGLKDNIKQDKEFLDDAGNLWMKITKDGKLVVSKGYAWDGNSPKIRILDWGWLGTPDGLMIKNKPITFSASLVHDALGQFKRDRAMPPQFKSVKWDLWLSPGRHGRDNLYRSLLQKAGFSLWPIYYLGVATFGPLYDSATVVQKKLDNVTKPIRTRYSALIKQLRFDVRYLVLIPAFIVLATITLI